MHALRDDHLKPDAMLHNTDSNSFITSKQDQNHGPSGLNKTRDVPEFQVTNRLIYNHRKGCKPRRHNVATMVNEPYLQSADDGAIARNRSAI